MDKQNKKILTYILLFVGLFIGYFILRDSTWIGSKQLHTIMEVISSLLALLIGIMALLHFYSKKNSTFLFIGAGFLGTSFLDTYHAIVTSTFFDLYFPSPPDSLIPWSWVAARLFLSVLLWFSYLAWVQEQKLGKTMVISEKAVYIISALLAITCFFFFAFVPLPRAYYPELFFSRPEEFVPAIFFLLALIGYLKKGHWKTDEFEHWLVLSLIVGFMAQVMFMSFSEHLFDTMFDSAHLLKKVSYICVLVGLFINIYIVYKTSDKYTQKLTKTNHYFETVIEDMVRVSQGLAQGKLNVMPIANYHGEFAQIKTSLITALSNQSRVIEDITQVSQGLANGNLSVVPKAEYNGDFVKIKEALEMALTNQNQVIEDITQVSQGLAEGNLSVVPKAEYNGDFIKIKEALEMALTNQNQVIEDITQVSQGLANGDLNIVPRASYKGDFLQIQEALQMALFNLKLVIEDIVHVSQGLAKGENVITQAEYKGDFGQINDALETASSKLTTAMKENTVQDWIKSGQANLDELIRGEQDITTLAKNIIGFLCKYVNAQVGLFYLVKKDEEIPYLQIIAGYAYVDDKQRPNKYLLGEGLVGEVALEKKPLIFAQTIEECPNIIRSGLANAMPRNLILLPCLYESKVKAVIEIGLQAKVSDTQYKFLEQVMSGIGIAINTADSRAKMQVILEQSQQQSEELQQKQQEMQDTNHKLRSQSEELQSQQEELQTQQEELRQTNEVLGERTSSLERQKGEIQNKNKALEQTKSEMQTAQEAILTKAKELELASKYKSEFLANMSHELRTPLNSLLILSQLLSENKKGNLDDKQVEYAKTMYSAGNDLLTLINDILDLSKVEAGKVEINWEDIDLSDLFNTIKQKFQPIAEDKNLGFDLTIATNIPTTIIADGQRIKQIVNNLLSNAFKFTNKGQIQILIERPTKVPINLGGHNLELNKTIAISVIDSGIGIPKNKQQVVFEAFQQADGSTSRKFGGTGLGLSISRQLTRLMGGEL
ncbi:MAG: GAF domain-containing protein, partial [Thiomargarita sp.]|nr:GAF domain-containing protein [Thiomargarita sp.]